MEGVDIFRLRWFAAFGIDARTTQSPAHREASPKCFTGWPCPPAGTHSNASFAAEDHSRFLSRGALAQSRGQPTDRGRSRLLNGAQQGLRIPSLARCQIPPSPTSRINFLHSSSIDIMPSSPRMMVEEWINRSR